VAQWRGQFSGRTHESRVKDAEVALKHAVEAFHDVSAPHGREKKAKNVRHLATRLQRGEGKMVRVYFELRLGQYFRSIAGQFIELVAALVIAGVSTQSSFAADMPSDRLLQAALGDHFTRFFCVSRFREMRTQIQHAYDASRLSYIAVPCRGLKCSEAEYSEGMQVLLIRAKGLSRADAKEVCSHYEVALKTIEREFARELDALVHFPRPVADPRPASGTE